MVAATARNAILCDPVAHMIELPRVVPPILALGAYLKNTVCLAAGTRARVSVELGNLESFDSLTTFEEIVDRWFGEMADSVVAVAHDLHPDFHSTRYGESLAISRGIPSVAVQHHHAHVASVMAEHGSEGPVLGLALDGFGLGANQESWGGELLYVTPAGYQRWGHLAPLKQPGADRAAREPWRMAAAVFHAIGRGREIQRRFARHGGSDIIARMLERDVNCPATSSCGRLFDAACGVLGVKPVVRFEGEAPMELERLAAGRLRIANRGWSVTNGVLDMLPTLEQLIPLEPEEGAGLFHGSLIAAMTDWVCAAAEELDCHRVVLSGGCFLNRILNAGLIENLAARNIETWAPISLSPGDTAISLGQAWVVAMTKA